MKGLGNGRVLSGSSEMRGVRDPLGKTVDGNRYVCQSEAYGWLCNGAKRKITRSVPIHLCSLAPDRINTNNVKIVSNSKL